MKHFLKRKKNWNKTVTFKYIPTHNSLSPMFFYRNNFIKPSTIRNFDDLQICLRLEKKEVQNIKYEFPRENWLN